MSQNSIIIPGSPLSGTNLASAITNANNSIATDFSGTSEPGTTWALMKWADTTNNILKIRNLANTAWISFMDLVTGNILTNAATATTTALAESASATTRFQISGNVGGFDASTVLTATTQKAVQNIGFIIPANKQLIIKRVRLSIESSCDLVVFPSTAGYTYILSGANYEASPDQIMSTVEATDRNVILSIYIRNDTSGSVTIYGYMSWWADLSIE